MEIRIFLSVNGGEKFEIHTSCSVPIGEGSIFGDYKVIHGASLKGGEFNDCESYSEDASGCDDCEGQITYLELKYLGDQTSTINVFGHKKHDNQPFYSKVVNPGETFSFRGTEKDQKWVLKFS